MWRKVSVMGRVDMVFLSWWVVVWVSVNLMDSFFNLFMVFLSLKVVAECT